MGGSMCLLLFDGGYIRCRDLHDDISLYHALKTDGSRVGTQIRRWGPWHVESLPRLLVRRGLVQFYRTEHVEDVGNCLLTALYYMEDECDLGELSESDLHDGISAREFNFSCLHLSQRDDDVVYALKWLPDGFRSNDSQNGAVYVSMRKGLQKLQAMGGPLKLVEPPKWQSSIHELQSVSSVCKPRNSRMSWRRLKALQPSC